MEGREFGKTTDQRGCLQEGLARAKKIKFLYGWRGHVFQLYLEGEQQTLPGAGEEDDAMKWSGELPSDGEYVIVVGGTRGNTSYTLNISVK